MAEGPPAPVLTPGHEVCIIGAGPAGLGAAYEAIQHHLRPLVLEQDAVIGGLSRTLEHHGFRFDIGGHRFYDKYPEVTNTWIEMLGEDWLEQERLSRICYEGQFFSYPLAPREALLKLGPWRSLKAVASYLAARLFPPRAGRDFESAIVRQFGRELYRTFFKTYSEKVWGIPCSQISADMAEARIRGFSLGQVLRTLLTGQAPEARTASSTYLYPRLGPGQLWDIYRARIEAAGGAFRLRHEVVRLEHDGQRLTAVTVRTPEGDQTLQPEAVISTMPLQDLCRRLDPAPPAPLLALADQLRYRDFISVVLIVDDPEPFPDTWIYIHSPDVAVGRIQNFRKWSPAMVPDPSKTCLGLEYFCYAGDEMWNRSDEALIAQGVAECQRLGLVNPARVQEGLVVRMPKAYVVYDLDHAERTKALAEYLGRFANLQPAGRNGQHLYLTQDESCLAGSYALRRLLGEAVTPWSIKTEEY